MTATPASASARTHDAGTRLRALYEREWTWRREQFAGFDDEDGEGAPADHLPRVDAATQSQREHYWRDVLAQLDALPLDQLGERDATDFAVYRAQIETLLSQQQFRCWEMPFNSDSAFWTDLGFTARRARHDADDYERYLGQLHDIPRYFNEHIANMRAGLARGFSVPRVTLTGREQSIAQVLDTACIKDNLFYTPFRTMPANIPADTQAHLRERAATAIRTVVLPAHAKLLDFIRDEYLPQARATLSAEAMPDGAAFYRAQIRRFTTLDMAPEAIHTLGLQEVARLREEMLATITRTGFNGGFESFLHYLRTDPQFYPQTGEQLLRQAAWIASRVDGCIERYIGRLPRRRFAIEPVPAELAPFYTSGRGGPGMYLLNTHDLPSRPLYALTALTLHEASPGHALQMPLAAELDGLPAFRRLTHISAYIEGWALYSEKLGVEMGLYETPYDHFGYLAYQAWRACRLVVDTGLHHLGWSRPQACTYLREHTALSEHEVRTEVDRYIAWPGQALSYYLGEMCIVQARAKAEQALGPRFDLRAFHDAVLASGSVPLPVLEQHIDRFIANGGRSPWADAASH